MIEQARRLCATLALAFATAVAPLAGAAQARVSYQPAATAQPKYAAIVVDATSGEVLYAKRADSPRYPASITKVMTLYLVFDALSTGRLKPDDLITVSPRAAAQAPTKLGLSAGETITVSDAMQAMAIKSANDMAVAMAEKLGGSESRFAAMMTLRAQELGMVNTHFVNASGLPDSRQLTTARDIAILSRAVMRDYPQYYRLFSQERFTYRGRTMNNHNGLLFRMPGVDGLKTGFTNASGYNLAVSAVRDNRRLIAVVMGGTSNAARDHNAQDLLLTGFDVMARRANGERILVAQNMFEPEPSGYSMQPSVEQGDGDQDGSRVVMTSTRAPANTSRFEIVDPRTTALHTDKADKKTGSKKAEAGRWAVQVGAFKSKALARTQLGVVEKKFGRHFAKADGQVSKDGSWRAQFKGFSESDARDACSALKAKKMPCMVVRPG
ncbi:MAG TPA: D-alanyl-D-alanine carboxypeptidase [Phenylobacterium sp.]|nr:D-alanyl-D-alanine carboxypeptidase [Phenylobacterium sp.]